MTAAEHPMLLLRTHVSQKLERKLLRQAVSSLLSAFGILWLADLLLPLAGIEELGIWRFVAGGGIIGISYAPYYQILRYKLSPAMLRVTDDELILTRQGSEVFRVPWPLVEEFHFVDGELCYGIAFSISPIETRPSIPKRLHEQSKKAYGVDLFLPFFSESSYQLLQNWPAKS
jgi:hypothetical protein